MVKITFYGGVKEIGGNKTLIEDNGTKIFLDFGMSFGKRALYFEEYLTPRSANGFGDFLEMGLIPDIKGVYRTDLIELSRKKEEELEIQAVILSHAHADHANYISFLHKDIPIYCGETCKYILEAVEEQSQRTMENEVIKYKKRPIYRSDYRKPAIKRIFKTFRTGDKIKIDSLEIEPMHVDHSVPGAYGFLIHTSEGTIIYTGDLRMHGLHSEMTEDFIKASKLHKPVVMISEGTRINTEYSDESETKVYNESKKHIMDSKNLSIVDFNFKDIDRFTTFYKISKELDKKLVINFKHACFLEKYHKDKKINAPDSKNENILIIKPKRLTGSYIKDDYIDQYIKDRLHYPNIVLAKDIAKNPLNYIIVLNFWYFNTLIDLKPRGGTYIHSLSEPFNEEMEISYDRMKNWLNHFHLDLIQSHCSGHICGKDLKNLIETVKPKKLYPIHTEYPGKFRNLDMKTIMVKEGKTYKL